MASEASAAERLEGSRLDELYRRHATKAKRTAFLLTGDANIADDLVQEAFVRLAGRFVDLRSADAFESYLRRTILNLARSHYRSAKRERSRQERAVPLASTPDVASMLAVRDALMKLSERQRAAVVLRYYEDLPEAQIADTLRCRPGTVKSLLSRGLDVLRIELGR